LLAEPNLSTPAAMPRLERGARRCGRMGAPGSRIQAPILIAAKCQSSPIQGLMACINFRVEACQ
jgi:hypothetical protein